MGRPTIKIKRDQQFNIGLSKAESEWLHQRAAATGMRPVDYGRAKLFAKRVSGEAPGVHHLDPLFLVSLSRIGNNLNQIARRLHKTAQPAPPSLEPLLRELQALLRKGMAR